MKEIYKKGGRKFGFLGVAPLGCQPFMKALVNGSEGACLEEAQTIVKQHNIALSLALKELGEQLKGFKYSFSNFFDMVTEVMSDPSRYGK